MQVSLYVRDVFDWRLSVLSDKYGSVVSKHAETTEVPVQGPGALQLNLQCESTLLTQYGYTLSDQ